MLKSPLRTALLLTLIPAAMVQAQTVLSKIPRKGPPSSSILGASAAYLRAEYAATIPGIVMVVSPNVLPPANTSLPRMDTYGDAIGVPHAATALAGVARPKEIVVAGRAQAVECGKKGSLCVPASPYLTAAFGIPVMKGDTAFVGANSALTIEPNLRAPAGSPARKGSVGSTEVYLGVVKEQGSWRVVGRKVLVRR